LIACKRDDQVAAVLSIYALTPLCPLPSNDEVLFCTPETTSEEVVNFVRVALKSDARKIYTLVNIEELSYESSKNADKCFSKLNASTNYVLVLMCTSDRQQHSILASSFAKYAVSYMLAPSSDLTRYLNTKLSNEPQRAGQSLACNIDPQRNCVKVLSSAKSGCGKTLFVKNLLERTRASERGIAYFNLPIKSKAIDTDAEIECHFHL
jgi:hypothetical protein